MFSWFLLLSATAVAAAVLYTVINFLSSSQQKQKKRNLPPRPFTIPFIGSVGLLTRRNTENRNKALFDISSAYGGIFRTRLGRLESYIVTSYALFREATIDKPMDFVSRPFQLNQLLQVNPNRLGIAEGDGSPAYMAYRKFVLVKLRSLGFGQRSMEDCILSECQTLLQEIQQADAANRFELRDLLCATTGNVIFSVLCSRHYGYGDEELTRVTRAGTEFIKQTALSGMLVAGFPFLVPVTPYIGRARRAHSIMHEFINGLIKERLNNTSQTPVTDNEEEAQDFLDVYLMQHRKEGGGESGVFNLEMLAHTLEDLFLGGFETTATSIQWLLLVMLNFPDLQQQIQQEIDEQQSASTAKADRLVTLADTDHLPLTVATIWEVWRLYPLLPFGVPHATKSDSAKLGAYDIEPNRAILFHIWSIHHDPALWREPEKFMPQRFLVPESDNSDKLIFKHPEQVVVFSVGRRSCIGEQLARKETFLIFANLMRKFHIKANGIVPELKERPGIIMYPPDFRVDFVPRN